ncbi:MAG: glycosyl transferase family 1 [Chloroflexi bacterium]|nr:MAG: glycosyl transferase family 1 [Chloroflexota bacterium]
MRVLMVSKACVLKAYRKKLEELAKLGVEIYLVVPSCWRDERGVLPLEEGEDGYQMLVDKLAFNGHYHLHFYPRLARYMREVKPDIVHIDEEPYNLATFQAMWLAQREEAKALFFTWQNLCRLYPPPFSWMERYNYRHASWAIAGNQEAVRVLRRKGYTGKVSVIPQFGVDEEIFHPADGKSESVPFTIGFVGRLVEEKGVHLLLRAVAKMQAPWRLRILGTGPWQLRLEELAVELGIAGEVSFEHQLPSLQLPDFYRSLDVLVLPSITKPNWKEQFGRVLVEAMACGVPVIGSSCGEIPNVVGEAGLIFPEGDVDALRDALERLRLDEGLRRSLSLQGRRRVLENYTQKIIAAKTFEVYQELL